MERLHKFQIRILKELSYNPRLRFSDLNVVGLTSEHFTYHLKVLQEKDWIEKKGTNYVLTDSGKELSNRIDDFRLKLEKQPKVSVIVIPERRNSKGEVEFLMHKRLKQPYYGKIGSVTGKVRFGESFPEAAARELREETGLEAELTLVKVFHIIVRKPGEKPGKKQNNGDKANAGSKQIGDDPSKNIVQDNIFVTFLAHDIKGKLHKVTAEGENFWMEYSKIMECKDLFADARKIYQEVKKNSDLRVIEEKTSAEGF